MCKVCEVGEVGGRVKECERRRALSLFIKKLVFFSLLCSASWDGGRSQLEKIFFSSQTLSHTG